MKVKIDLDSSWENVKKVEIKGHNLTHTAISLMITHDHNRHKTRDSLIPLNKQTKRK